MAGQGTTGAAAGAAHPGVAAPAVRKRGVALALTTAVMALLCVPAVAAGAWWLSYEYRAYAVLRALEAPPQVAVPRTVAFAGAGGTIRGRLYVATRAGEPRRGIVLVHGMKAVGIDDPRLKDFAQALAAHGFAVLTPAMPALADFHVDAATIAAIGDSTEWLSDDLGERPVTAIGLSFAGSLTLLAAAQPQFAPYFRCVVTVGAYDEPSHVAQFLATGTAPLPNGGAIAYPPHPYGAGVMIYDDLDALFTPGDRAAAQAALALWLSDRADQARAQLAGVSAAGRKILDPLFANDLAALAPTLAQTQRDRAADMAEVSLHGRLQGLRVPVYLLEGYSDNIIPWSETLWLERDIPPRALRGALVSNAFKHVYPTQRGNWEARLVLIHFFARILHTAGG